MGVEGSLLKSKLNLHVNLFHVLLQKQVKQYYLDAMRHTSRFNLCKGYLAISELSVNQNAKRGEEGHWKCLKCTKTKLCWVSSAVCRTPQKASVVQLYSTFTLTLKQPTFWKKHSFCQLWIWPKELKNQYQYFYLFWHIQINPIIWEDGFIRQKIDKNEHEIRISPTRKSKTFKTTMKFYLYCPWRELQQTHCCWEGAAASFLVINKIISS